MKVGILTLHKSKNYGAVLQLYALKTILEKKAIDTYIIDRYSVHKNILYYLYFKLYPKHFIFSIKWFFFDKFNKKYLSKKTRKYTSTKSLTKFCQNENFDICIVGSDQVWRLEYSDIGLNYFFDFIEDSNVKKISYAASFGLNDWNENIEITLKIKNLLKNFTAISVREESGIKICNDIFNVDASLVLDPTLLLDKEDYEKLFIKKQFKRKSGKIISYILGNNKEAISKCKKVSQELNYEYSDLYSTCSILEYFTLNRNSNKNIFHVSVENWLFEINNADYIITNSFHGTVFSIIFEKQFIVIDHKTGGSDRIYTLLKILGLEDRFFVDENSININNLNRVVNFKEVKEKLELIKTDSLSFIAKYTL